MALALRKRKDKAAEYFNKLAGKFGRTYIPGRSWQALAHALLRLLPAMVIADLGAGEGTLSQLLARGAKKVIAIDNSEKMVEFGGQPCARTWLSEISSIASATLKIRRSSTESVDLALFSQALHHASSPQKAVSAAHRILRDGGRVVVLDLASHSHEQARELFARRLARVLRDRAAANSERRQAFRRSRSSVVSRESAGAKFSDAACDGHEVKRHAAEVVLKSGVGAPRQTCSSSAVGSGASCNPTRVSETVPSPRDLWSLIPNSRPAAISSVAPGQEFMVAGTRKSIIS